MLLWRCGAPQNRAEDWTLGSHGCYDVASLTRTQMQLRYDFPSVAQARPPPAVCCPAHSPDRFADQAQINSSQWRSDRECWRRWHLFKCTDTDRMQHARRATARAA